MPGRAEQLFQQLQNPAAVLALIGQSEDAHFDCKEWPSRDESAQHTFAKAACGLANAEGGVLIIGMRARPTSKDQPDVVESAVPVSDTSAVKSRILDLVGQLVEPGIEGIQAVEVNESPDLKSGFVIVHIPASEALPRRSRKDWKFYLRIGSGTFPMEYFQIVDMFGQRPQPNLELLLEEESIGTTPRDKSAHQFLWLGLSNVGRGIAKFPSVQFKREGHGFVAYEFGIDGNGGHALPLRPSENEWVVFRGGVDDVIYPATTLKITKLERRYSRIEQITDRWVFGEVRISAEISCEGMPTKPVEKVIPERRHNR
jgi:hypothetical protein